MTYESQKKSEAQKSCESQKSCSCGCDSGCDTTQGSHATCGCDSGCDTTQGAHAACDCSMPQVTFSTFILSLASSALVQLGEVPDPESGQMQTDLVMAKHSIEILSMLQNKTRECLDPDESRLMEGLLYELRMKYVMKKG